MDTSYEGLKDRVSPFQWNLKDIPHRNPTSLTIKKLLQKIEDRPKSWILLYINLTLSYLYFEENKHNEALASLDKYLQILNTSNQSIVGKYREALACIYSAAYEFLKSYSKKEEEQKISTTHLPTSQLAAVYAMKALVHLEFGRSGMEKAVIFAKEAVELNKEEGEWNFLLASTLNRVRHFKEEYDYDSIEEEIGYLRKAFELCYCSEYAVFLALALIERITYAKRYGRWKPSKDECEAKALIQLAIELNLADQSPRILFRCAAGLYKLPKPERDLTLAKELLLKGLEQAPMNALANKLAGDIYWKENQLELALQYMRKAATMNVYSADCAVFTLEYKLGKNPDPERHFSRLLETYTDRYGTMFSLINGMEFYLFIERDLFKALHYFVKAVSLDPMFPQLKKKYVFQIQTQVNFYNIICNETRIALDEHFYQSDEQKKTLNDILAAINKLEPGLMHIPTDKKLIQKLSDNTPPKVNFKSSRGKGRINTRGGSMKKFNCQY